MEGRSFLGLLTGISSSCVTSGALICLFECGIVICEICLVSRIATVERTCNNDNDTIKTMI